MSNQLTFRTFHKSITSLAETTLPELVVLTGRNGSGKTHLLEAIKSGNISSSLVADKNVDVLLFDWNSIIPKDTGIYHSSQHQTQRSNWFQQIRNQQENTFRQIQAQAISWGIPTELCSSLSSLKAITEAVLLDKIGDETKAKAIYTQINQLLINSSRNIYSKTQRNIGDEILKKAAPLVLNEDPKLFLEASESKFFNNSRFLWGEVDAFQQAFGRLFSTYRDLIHQNDRLEKYPSQENSDLKYLNEHEFIQEYGEAPWDFVNRILEVSCLDFRVVAPPLHEVSSYEPRLKKISKEIEMRFQDLSSGEKVLMSFALCLYNASDDRQQKHFPKLLLLDEIDAPLHPSMVLSLLKTIKKVLVDEKNVSVILTTHSPSTVALAHEDTLFEMNPDGPSIDKVSSSRALSILTEGVPTLSISFDGRKQVFVESKTDAFIYEKLYQCYKNTLDTEKSLTFIEVGRTDSSGGEHNSGCEQVKRIVNSLFENGNSSSFGLIDWDGEREPTNRIHILSESIRNGIESLIFDPVLIATTIIKENLQYCIDNHIIDAEDRYTHISHWETDKWQTVVNRIQEIIIGSEQESGFIEISYLNGITLNISKAYLHLDDHALEERITSKFRFLRPKNNHAGGLMKHVIVSILGDYPNLLPYDLINSFKSILDSEV